MWGAGLETIPEVLSLLAQIEPIDPDLFYRTYMLWLGWADADSRRRKTAAYIASRRPEHRAEVDAAWAATHAICWDLLPHLDLNVLLLGRDDFVKTREGSLAIARKLPKARRISLEGDAQPPELGDTDAVLRALEEFDTEQLSGPKDRTNEGFRTILFTDLESSTALTQRVGDESAQEVLRDHNATVRKALDEHTGREIKHTGDGIMASFPSAVAAVTAASQIQQQMEGSGIRVRIGTNAGEPIAEDDDLFGTAVQLAARITDRAEPGQVLVSNVVRELCAGKTFRFHSLGEANLKGFDDPVPLFEVRSA